VRETSRVILTHALIVIFSYGNNAFDEFRQLGIHEEEEHAQVERDFREYMREVRELSHVHKGPD
jgi:hypothetical protein